MTKDRYGREIDTLRISVTQACNLACPYCHREGENRPKDMMSVDEIRKIASACALLGIRRVKITGGEPLARDDILDVIRSVSSVPGISELSMTTNGTLLKGMSKELKDAGLTRLNIGCDSLSSSVLEKTANNIKVKDNIFSAKKAGFTSVKLNMVVMKGLNHENIDDMITFSKECGSTLQLIELVRTAHNSSFYSKHFFSLEDIEHNLKEIAESIETRPMHNRKKYHAGGAVIEIVRPHKNGFCENCRTLRLTSDGKMKPCLMRDDNLTDILGKIREGASSSELEGLIIEAIGKREPYSKGQSERGASQ